MAIDAYRSRHETPGKKPDRELVYVARERDVNAAFHRVWIRTILLGTVGVVACAAAGVPELGWAPFVIVLAWSIVEWRRTRRGSAVTLRCDGHELIATADRGRTVPLACPLKSVLDVELDTKTIQPVQRNTSVESIAIGAHVRGSIDVSRVVLVPMAPREPVALSEDHVAHMDAVEAAGAIRRFLRSHGWLPEDERVVD